MDNASSIIDQQRTYYLNGTYDEAISKDQPKPPPMLPHGDDIYAIPSRTSFNHPKNQKWSERRKNRDKKRKRMETSNISTTGTANHANVMKPKTTVSSVISGGSSLDGTMVTSLNDRTNNSDKAEGDDDDDDDDAKTALPASEIPQGFPEELVFRTMAAYATLRTLSVQLRLSPFTPTAFLRAIYLPYPNRLIGSVHVHILRVLLHNLQMGYNWKDSATGPPPLDVVKKRRIDHIKWPLRAGDNLRFLDMHTWPIFYDDYCHLTADVIYASLYDISDHVDARTLHLNGIADRFSTTLPEVVPKQAPQYLDDTHQDEDIDVIVDSDEDYKLEEEDDDVDAFEYDDESYGKTKKRKKKGKTSKAKQRKSEPMSSTGASVGSAAVTGSGSTGKDIAKVNPTFPTKPQHLIRPTQSFPMSSNAMGLSSTYPQPPLASYQHQQRQQHLFEKQQQQQQHRQQYTFAMPQHRHQYPSTIPQHSENRNELMFKNVSPFHRPRLIPNGPTFQEFQPPHKSANLSNRQIEAPSTGAIGHPISGRPGELQSIRRTMSLDQTVSRSSDLNSNTKVSQPSRDNVEFTILRDVDSAGKQREIIVIDSPDSSSEDNTVVKNSAVDAATAARSRRMRKYPKSRSFVGSKELHFFQERYGLKNPPDVPSDSMLSTDGSDDINSPFQKRRRVDVSDSRPIRDDSSYSFPPSESSMNTNKNVAYDAEIEKPLNSVHSRNSVDHSRNLVDPPHQRSAIAGASYHGVDTHQRPSYDETTYDPIYRKRPSHSDYNAYSKHAPNQSIKFSSISSDAPLQPALAPVAFDNYLPLRPSPIQRTNPMMDKSDGVEAVADAPVEVPPLAPPRHLEHPSSRSNDGSIPGQKDKESIENGNGTSETEVSQCAVAQQVSKPQPEALHQSVATTTTKNISGQSVNSHNTAASNEAANRLRAFIQGNYKPANATLSTTNEGDAILNESIIDSVTFPIDEPQNWSHFAPLKKMRMGSPYHTLSVKDKLTILEFLIDELLSVPWVANEFTLRHESNAPHAYPYGPSPTDAEMQAVKDADGELHDELCKVCNEIGDVVCCDGCVSVYHGECAGFLNASKLPDVWYCPECAVKDPSSFGPLRSLKKSEVDWFTIADVQAADRSRCLHGQENPIDFKAQPQICTRKFLTIHGFVFCQSDQIDVNGSRSILKLQPSAPKVLAPPKLRMILKSFGQDLCSKWPIEQIPINAKALWASVNEPKSCYFEIKEYFDPTTYKNKYHRAPILLEGIRRPKESFVYEEKILNDSSTPSCTVDLFTCDVSKDGAIVASIRTKPKTYDALQVIKSCLLKIENDLSKAFLLDEFWEVREMNQKNISWKESVKHCNTIRSLSRLLLRLVDATHHRAFEESWTLSLVAKSKEGASIQSVESVDLGSTGFNPEDEALYRCWKRGRSCHLPTLLLKTSKYLIEKGQKSRIAIAANHSKRKSATRKSNQFEIASYQIKHVENGMESKSFGDVDIKRRNRREDDSLGTNSPLSTSKVDSRLGDFIRLRVETLIRESKQLVHREVHWPVAGRKLFDPIGYLPAVAIRYLGRNGGAHFAPFVDYSTLHEVGQVAYCHVWRKQVSLCAQFECLIDLIRILTSHMNQHTINKCISLANGGKTSKGKNTIAIHKTQRDLQSGVDYHLVGLGQPVTKPGRWESSIAIDLGVLVQERVRRSKFHVDAAINKTKMQAAAKLPVQAKLQPDNKTWSMESTGPSARTPIKPVQSPYTGSGYQNATMLAANIITSHIEETKKLIRMHGVQLSTEHMITLRKKTDYDLAQVFVGKFAYVNENGRIEMMMKAEESARESMNQANVTLPQSNPSRTSLIPDTRQAYQATLFSGTVASSGTSSTQSIPALDLNEIMKSGTPFDWSKRVVKYHKDFAQSLCQKYGHASFSDSELDASRRQCIGHLNTIFTAAGLQYGFSQISAVINEAENEARADFLLTSKNVTTLPGSHNSNFLSPDQASMVPVSNHPNNVLELQTYMGHNTTNPYVASGSSFGGNSCNVLQSQSNYLTSAGVPSSSTTIVPNVTSQARSSRNWNTEQPINANTSIQSWQLGTNGTSTAQFGTYSAYPQQATQLHQMNSLLSNNQNISTPSTTTAYTSQSLQQQQWLSSQQQLTTPSTSNLSGQQNQMPYQSYNTRTPWSSTMPSSMYGQQQ